MPVMNPTCKKCGKRLYAEQSVQECGMCARKRRDLEFTKVVALVRPKQAEIKRISQKDVILAMLPANSSEIASRLGMTFNQVEVLMAGMQNRGLVKRRNWTTKREGGWEVRCQVK